ncbi:MAG TPA: GAF domain-containing protein [Chitinophagaceae bacterium]
MNGTDKKNYDSDFCGSLPLHLINLIQPYGVLLVLDPASLEIIQASENAGELLSIEPARIINTSLRKHIAPDQFKRLEELVKSGGSAKSVFNFTLEKKNKVITYNALVHVKHEYVILEIDIKTAGRQSSFIDIFQELKLAIAGIESAINTEEVCEKAITELKKLSGFDRIMIYQFDEDWNGVVIAEAAEPDMDPYLGLRFPASDIPKQARDLYLKNAYRLIPTREYQPVRLYPVINPKTGAFIDLSDCNLRSVAAVHLEYLKNMGVTASMSTRILRDNKLWGLISCHHRTEKYLDYETCSLFELMSIIISGKLGSIQNHELYSFNSRLKSIQSSLMKQVYETDDLYDGLFKRDVSLLELLNAGGAALVDTKQVRVIGNAPSKDQIREMVYWLQSNSLSNVFHVTNLGDVYEPAQSYTDVASGIIVIPGNDNRGEYIIGFRPEVVREVNWGGNPNEAINFEKDQVSYHPRNSFRLWQQVVKNTSLPWLPGEVMVAEDFRKYVWNTR